LSVLPAFNPDDDRDPLPASVAELRAEIAAADAVIFCTPEYAGNPPGSRTNLLDWIVGGTEISAKPIVWINVAATGRGGGRRSCCKQGQRHVDRQRHALRASRCGRPPRR
jgi:chromate reductase, NAD(P)H dehydrogenase (quinone)